MATSSTYTRTVTFIEILKESLRFIGALESGETPTADETADAISAMNSLIQQWQGPPNFLLPGDKMWQRETGLLTLDSTKNSYSLKPSGGQLDIQIPIAILPHPVMRHTSSSADTEMSPMTIEDYLALTNKSVSGFPLMYYYEKRLTEGTLYLDVKPSSSVASAYKISFVYLQPMEIISGSTDEFDIDPSYYRALKYHLGRELAPEYGRQLTQDMKDLISESLALAQTFNPENAPEDLYFQPGIDE